MIVQIAKKIILLFKEDEILKLSKIKDPSTKRQDATVPHTAMVYRPELR